MIVDFRLKIDDLRLQIVGLGSSNLQSAISILQCISIHRPISSFYAKI